MNDLFQSLKTEFQDEDYRYAYAQSFLNTKLASQIKTLREQRGMTQAKAASEMEIKQPGYRRFEDVNHSVWKTDSLWNIARVYGVRLDISFKTFGTLPEEKERLTKKSLQLPKFEDDPAFKEPAEEPLQAEIAIPAFAESLPKCGALQRMARGELKAEDFTWLLRNTSDVAAQIVSTAQRAWQQRTVEAVRDLHEAPPFTGLQPPEQREVSTDKYRGLFLVPKPSAGVLPQSAPQVPEVSSAFQGERPPVRKRA
jgi:transcriptional regulator with XRE-family HTH domain